MFEYKAQLIRVVDGDTVWLRVDLGFRLYAELDFRLFGINAPEISGPKASDAGNAAKQYLEDLLAPLSDGKPQVLTIWTTKPDKYGRWLATIIDGIGENVNSKMLQSGNAVKYP